MRKHARERTSHSTHSISIFPRKKNRKKPIHHPRKPLTAPQLSHPIITATRHPITISLPHYHPTETFPVFQTGNVFIYSSLVDPPLK